MRLLPCPKPVGKLVPIDTPLSVKGQLFQTYRKELADGQCEHYEHNQTRDVWLKLVKKSEVQP